MNSPPTASRPSVCRGTSPSSWTATAAGPQARGLPRIEGHRRGVKSVRLLVEECCRLGLEQLTLYCLSSENWKRPQRELSLLMHLLEQYVIEERSEIMRQNIRFTTIGRRDGLNEGVLREVDKTIDFSRQNTGMGLCLALNYGARSEIVDAVREIARKVADRSARRRRGHRRDGGLASLYGRHGRSRSRDPHGGRNASEQFPLVADQLRGAVGHRDVLARFPAARVDPGAPDFAARDRRFGGLKD